MKTITSIGTFELFEKLILILRPVSLSLAFPRSTDAREMRGPMRCELVAMQCAVQAGWLHSRGAGGTMLLTEGF